MTGKSYERTHQGLDIDPDDLVIVERRARWLHCIRSRPRSELDQSALGRLTTEAQDLPDARRADEFAGDDLSNLICFHCDAVVITRNEADWLRGAG